VFPPFFHGDRGALSTTQYRLWHIADIEGKQREIMEVKDIRAPIGRSPKRDFTSAGNGKVKKKARQG